MYDILLCIFCVGLEDDFDIFTTELVFTNDSLTDKITLEAFRDDEQGREEFESFLLELIHGANILPDNIVLDETVITIMDVGVFINRYVCDYFMYNCSALPSKRESVPVLIQECNHITINVLFMYSTLFPKGQRYLLCIVGNIFPKVNRAITTIAS